MGNDFDIKTYLAIIRRRYLYFVLPAVVVFAAICVVAFKLPPTYEASAKILVESQRIPEDLATPTVTASTGERLQFIVQRLMTRENLLQISEKFGLYRDDGNLSPTEIIGRVREAMRIEALDVGSQAARRAFGVIGFTVSFQSRNPETAWQVTNELVALILAQNLQTRMVHAAETTKFFEQRLEKLEQQLVATEARIAEFKRSNGPDLPDTLSYRQTSLLQLTNEIAGIDRQIQSVGQSAALLAGLGEGTSDFLDLDYRLQAKQLALESVKEERDTLAPLADRGIVPVNRIRDLDRAVAAAELNVRAIQAQIALGGGTGVSVEQLEAQRAELQKRSDEIKASIQRTPQIEAEFRALTRNYENLQSEYEQTQAKLAEASVGERLEEDRQAERFEVLEQATIPTKPATPDKTRIVMAGSFASMAIGATAVVLMELLDKSIRTVGDIEKRLHLRPIAAIPYVMTAAQRRRRRWRLVTLALLTVGALAAILFMVHTYYLPLDLLLDRISQRIGL